MMVTVPSIGRDDACLKDARLRRLRDSNPGGGLSPQPH
jgi:hypothetical protein